VVVGVVVAGLGVGTGEGQGEGRATKDGELSEPGAIQDENHKM
jgi:hypothetical protein